MHEAIATVLEYLRHEDPGGVIGLYLYGSATAGGLLPDSDIDLLLLTRRSLRPAERRALVGLLLGVSGWRGHEGSFPECTSRRPVDLTSVVVESRSSWWRSPRRDFQFGEWLREELVGGSLPQPTGDSDVVIVIATALASHQVLHGPPLSHVVGGVSHDQLRHAIRSAVPALLAELEGDERNVLLTLARMLVTLETGRIVAKDVAAASVAKRLDGQARKLMERARAAYLGRLADDWSADRAEIRQLAHHLASRAQHDEPW